MPFSFYKIIRAIMAPISPISLIFKQGEQQAVGHIVNCCMFVIPASFSERSWVLGDYSGASINPFYFIAQVISYQNFNSNTATMSWDVTSDA